MGRDTTETTAEQRRKRHMARLVGVDLPRDKRIEIALTYIYGIGRTRSKQLLETTGVDPNAAVHTLGDEELVKLANHIEATSRSRRPAPRGRQPTSAARSKIALTRAADTRAASRCADSAPDQPRGPQGPKRTVAAREAGPQVTPRAAGAGSFPLERRGPPSPLPRIK
jgi:small subunit ribosomal protein S13